MMSVETKPLEVIMAEKEMTKVEKFVELGVKRVPKAIAAIGSVEKLANKGNYEYTEKQAAQIVKDLRAAVDKAEKAFKDGKAQAPMSTYTL